MTFNTRERVRPWSALVKAVKSEPLAVKPDPEKDFQPVEPAAREIGAGAIDRFSAVRDFAWGSEDRD